MSFNTKPFTVLLTPPKSSLTGSEGMAKDTGAADLTGNNVEKMLRAGEAAGVRAGGHVPAVIVLTAAGKCL